MGMGRTRQGGDVDKRPVISSGVCDPIYYITQSFLNLASEIPVVHCLETTQKGHFWDGFRLNWTAVNCYGFYLTQRTN